MKKAKEEGTEVKAVMDYCKEKMNVCVTEEQLENIAALKVAMRRLADQYGCNGRGHPVLERPARGAGHYALRGQLPLK